MADREHELVTMSFGEHLEELRRRLFRVLLVVAVGTVLALTIQGPLLKALTAPHRKAMARIQVAGEARACLRELALARHRFEAMPEGQGRRLLDALEASEAVIAAFELARREQSHDATLAACELAFLRPQDRTHADLAQRLFNLVEQLPARIEHAIEVASSNAHESLTDASAELERIAARRVLWRAAPPAGTELDAVALEQLVDELSQARGHLTRVVDASDPAGLTRFMDPELRLAALSYTEIFFSYLRVCLIAGLAVGLPWLTFEIWFFIAGGLYHMERHAVFPFIPMSLGMLVLGALFAYWVLVPVGGVKPETQQHAPTSPGRSGHAGRGPPATADSSFIVRTPRTSHTP